MRVCARVCVCVDVCVCVLRNFCLSEFCTDYLSAALLFEFQFSDFLLRGLYQLIRVSITSLVNSKPDRPVCLVVDDLSTVLSIGVDVKAVVDFVHYSQQMLCAPDGLCKVNTRRLS